jgi:hypothetical protein
MGVRGVSSGRRYEDGVWYISPGICDGGGDSSEDLVHLAVQLVQLRHHSRRIGGRRAC